MKAPQDRAGRPLTEPKEPRWTRHHRGQRHPDLVGGYIIPIMLANGYWAYRPQRLDSLPGNWPYLSARQSFPYNAAPSRKRIYEIDLYYYRRTGQPKTEPSKEHRRIDLDHWYSPWDGAWYYNDPPPAVQKKSLVKRLADGQARSRSTTVLYTIPHADRIVVDAKLAAKEVETKENGPRPPVSLQQPLSWVRDDPVENGRELAAASDKLPSDRWQASAHATERRRRDGVLVISREEKELQDALRNGLLSDGSEKELSLNSIVHDEPVYSVRVVPRKRRGKSASVDKGKEVDTPTEEPVSEMRDEIAAEELDGDIWAISYQNLRLRGGCR